MPPFRVFSLFIRDLKRFSHQSLLFVTSRRFLGLLFWKSGWFCVRCGPLEFRFSVNSLLCCGREAAPTVTSRHLRAHRCPPPLSGACQLVTHILCVWGCACWGGGSGLITTGVFWLQQGSNGSNDALKGCVQCCKGKKKKNQYFYYLKTLVLQRKTRIL